MWPQARVNICVAVPARVHLPSEPNSNVRHADIMTLSYEAADELDALSAIYGDDCDIDPGEGSAQLYLPCRDSRPRLVVRVHFPRAYPGSEPPLCELQVPPHVSDDTATWAADELGKIFVPGQQLPDVTHAASNPESC